MPEYIYKIESDESDESEVFIGYIRNHSQELIRCRYCRFSTVNDGVYRGSDSNGRCIAMGAVVSGDDYCSWAERDGTEKEKEE